MTKKSFSSTKLLVLFLITIATNLVHGQDGSDILYLKADSINDSYTGKKVQFDFFNRSFGGLTLDTVSIDLNGRAVKFVEHRKDNGYNNWFSQQYLQSVDKINGYTLRLVYNQINRVTKDEIFVTSYFDLYRKNNKRVLDSTVSKEHSFKKSMITEVLVQSD
jgi:hypothetical protein